MLRFLRDHLSRQAPSKNIEACVCTYTYIYIERDIYIERENIYRERIEKDTEPFI